MGVEGAGSGLQGTDLDDQDLGLEVWVFGVREPEADAIPRLVGEEEVRCVRGVEPVVVELWRDVRTLGEKDEFGEIGLGGSGGRGRSDGGGLEARRPRSNEESGKAAEDETESQPRDWMVSVRTGLKKVDGLLEGHRKRERLAWSALRM